MSQRSGSFNNQSKNGAETAEDLQNNSGLLCDKLHKKQNHAQRMQQLWNKIGRTTKNKEESNETMYVGNSVIPMIHSDITKDTPRSRDWKEQRSCKILFVLMTHGS